MSASFATWVLIFYTLQTTPERKESVTYSRNETTYETHAACQNAGDETLAVIDMTEGYNAYFACVPAGAIEPKAAEE